MTFNRAEVEMEEGCGKGSALAKKNPSRGRGGLRYSLQKKSFLEVTEEASRFKLDLRYIDDYLFYYIE